MTYMEEKTLSVPSGCHQAIFSVRNGALQSCGFAAESTQIAVDGGAPKHDQAHKPTEKMGKLTYKNQMTVGILWILYEIII